MPNANIGPDIANQLPHHTPDNGLIADALIRKGEGMSKLDDPDRMMEIIKEELDFYCNHVTPRAIVNEKHLEAGAQVNVDPNWRTAKMEAAPFPNDGVMGKTTEIGFRQMVRAALIGARENLHFSQFNGSWHLKSYSIRKGKEGVNDIEIKAGKVFVSGDGENDASMLSSVVTARLGYTSSDTGSDAPPNTTRRTCTYITFEFVDISGNVPVRYKDGHTMTDEQERARDAGSAVDRLATILAEALGNKAVKAPVSGANALAAAAAEAGVDLSDFQKALARVKSEKEAEKAAHPLAGRNSVQEWMCPVKGCPFSSAGDRRVGPVNHLKAHVTKGEITQDQADAYMVEWDAWNAKRS